MQKRKKVYSDNGITLIALVISIIVMLILAGVSLNATIGDNGIITQAQKATYMQSIAALEEYLQTEYVKYYDETENYTSKIELLSSKIGNLCLKDGTKNYITYDGKMYYLINKQALPDELKNQLKGGDTTEYLKYIRLQDVYGVTPDLKVYYCESGTDSALGTLDSTELDPNTPLKKINQDAEMKSAITEALASVGVTVGENGVTVGDAVKLKNLELDGSKHNITSISGLSELSSLKTVTLSNLNLNDLDGLQNCTLLYYVYFKNCKVNDYSKLATVLDLQYLYLYLPPSMSEADANAQVTNLGNGLANATEMNKLEYLGIVGNTDMVEGEYSLDPGAGVNYNKYQYSSGAKNNLTDITNLNKFSSNIKSTIKYVYMNNNSFNSIESLKDFSNIYELDLMYNRNLLNLDGLENHSNLVYLFAQSCNLQTINGLQGQTKLKYLTIQQNANLASLNGLEDSTDIDYIRAFNCNIIDITALENNTKLRMLNLENNVNLENVITLGTCTGIKKLYLLGNEKMIGTEVRDALANPNTHILQNCGSNYTIPSKYSLYFSTLTSYDYSNLGLTDDSDEINSLKNKTNVTRLNLSGNPNLSNSKLQEILSTMTGLKVLSLNNCKNLSSIDFVGDGKVTQLMELDLRNTNAGLTDLSNLNNYAKNLITLIVNNENLQLSSIQDTINNLWNNSNFGNFSESWISKESWGCRGIILLGNIEKYSFENCKNIVGINCSSTYIDDSEKLGSYIDLSKCSNLQYIRFSRKCGIKFPETLTQVWIDAREGAKYNDFSNTKKVKNLDIGYMSQKSMDAIFPDAKNINLQVERLTMTGTYMDGLDNLKFLKYIGNETLNFLQLGYDDGRNMLMGSLDGLELCENLTTLKIYKNEKLTDIQKIGVLKNLTDLEIRSCKNLKNLTGLNNATKLEKLNFQNNGLNDISAINELQNLKIIDLSNNNIAELMSFGKLNNLESLTLNNNNISNLSNLDSLIGNRSNLNKLFLSNNILQTNAIDGHNNVETLKKLYNAGLRTLDISGNNFTAGSTDELKSLKWTSYKE